MFETTGIMTGAGETKKTASNTRSTGMVCECASFAQILMDVKKKLEACYKIINGQNAKIEEMSNTIVTLSNKLEEKINSDTQKLCSETGQMSYSKAVNSIKNMKEPVLVVKPMEKSDGTLLRQQLFNSINPEKLQVGVHINKVTTKGDIILRCDNQQSLVKVKETIENSLSGNCSVALPTTFNPRVKIVGIHKEEYDQEADILRIKIVNQNNIIFGCVDDKLKIVFKYPIKDNKFNLVIELDPVLYNKVMEVGKLNIGWNRCKVFDHLSVMRCFKCCEYGHMQKQCTNPVVCPLCAGNHEKKDCQSNDLSCKNCVISNIKYKTNDDAKHAVWDRNCSCFKRMQTILRRKTNYST